MKRLKMPKMGRKMTTPAIQSVRQKIEKARRDFKKMHIKFLKRGIWICRVMIIFTVFASSFCFLAYYLTGSWINILTGFFNFGASVLWFRSLLKDIDKYEQEIVEAI